MKDPVWPDRRATFLLHPESLAENGGSSEIRHQELLDSSLAPARNQYLHDVRSDLAKLAAAYDFGLAKNHAINELRLWP